MTNVDNFPDIKHMDIEILDWNFDGVRRSLTVDYHRDGNILVTRGIGPQDLLDLLDRCFIIDRHQDETVEFHMDTEEFTGEDMRQRRYNYQCGLAEFMKSLFTSDDVYRIVCHIEKEKAIKRRADLIADKVQATIRRLQS